MLVFRNKVISILSSLVVVINAKIASLASSLVVALSIVIFILKSPCCIYAAVLLVPSLFTKPEENCFFFFFPCQ